MNEVKRYIENLIPGHPPPVVEACDGYLCLYADFQSERAARIEAERRLAELEDAVAEIAYKKNSNEYGIMRAVPENSKLFKAISNSRARSKG